MTKPSCTDLENLSSKELAQQLWEILNEPLAEENRDKVRLIVGILNERAHNGSCRKRDRLDWFEYICRLDRKLIRKYERRRRTERFLAFFGRKNKGDS